jgi:methylglutaconyl-CoA hydratase
VSLTVTQQGAVTTLTIDRPEARNAFDEALIAALNMAFEDASPDPTVRVIVLAATGPVFCAGGDLAWMRRMAAAPRDENVEDARAFAHLLRQIDQCPKPTIARVQGAAFGGGLGLIAACDIAVAVDGAEFATTEVRLGLVPAVISPYVIRAVGLRAARRLFVTGERFTVAEALRIGLVHEVVSAADLGAAVDRQVASLLAGGPAAIAAAKRLVAEVGGRIDQDTINRTVETLSAVRASAEAHEGIAAFFAKRSPRWSG